MKCKYDKYCGNCIGIDKDSALELKDKQKYIEEIFKGFSCVHPIVTNYYPFKYRNKIQLGATQLKGKTLLGFFEEGSTRITDIDGCILNGDWSYTLISILREFMSRFKIRGFIGSDGILRYIHARCINNCLQLTLVTITDNFPGKDWLYKKLKENFERVSLYININRRTDHAIFDNIFKFVSGDKFLKFDMCGVHVSITPACFLQVNLSIAEKMYKSAMAYLDINPETTVIDLYSGIGITSIMFAKHCKQVVSIEENYMSHKSAINMAKDNSVNNIRFYAGKCEEMLDKIDGAGDLVVFVDPARNGIEKCVLDKIRLLHPRKIVYMSCNPESCVRDVNNLLIDNKYIVTDISPYNMFPYTKHIEVLVCLQRHDLG